MRMEDQVLSIEQMKKLESLGLNTSDGSMFYDVNPVWNPGPDNIKYVHKKYPKFKEEYTKLYFDTEQGKHVMFTYTLQDILEKLPTVEHERCAQIIRCYNGFENETYYNCSYLHETGYESYPKFDQYGSTALEAAYNMLIWCIENKYIDVNNTND